jgi:L-serine dehydratase
MLAASSINIATMSVYRHKRGGKAIMVVEVDHDIPEAILIKMRACPGISKVTYVGKEE